MLLLPRQRTVLKIINALLSPWSSSSFFPGRFPKQSRPQYCVHSLHLHQECHCRRERDGRQSLQRPAIDGCLFAIVTNNLWQTDMMHLINISQILVEKN